MLTFCWNMIQDNHETTNLWNVYLDEKSNKFLQKTLFENVHVFFLKWEHYRQNTYMYIQGDWWAYLYQLHIK